MLNTDDFIKRLLHLTDYYGLNAAVFADKIGVQRSSISHLMSGRNKPSLDFVMKILDVFPDVNLYWFLNGKGNFLKSETPVLNPKSTITEPAPIFEIPKIGSQVLDLFESATVVENQKNSVPINLETQKSNPILKVIIFYSDGTFVDFKYGILK